jgi:ribosomal protein L9
MEIENRRLQIEVQIAESRTELEKLRQKIEGLEQNLLETQNKKMRLGQQIDNTRVANRRARQGEEVRVRKAALGSYFLNLGSNRAVRVRRE